VQISKVFGNFGIDQLSGRVVEHTHLLRLKSLDWFQCPVAWYRRHE